MAKKYLYNFSFIILLIAVLALWLTALFHISNLWRGDSDNAFLVITGNAVLKGNYFLKGYYLSGLATYFPADIYLNALLIKFLGFGPVVVHVAAILIFIALIIVSFFYVNEAGKNSVSYKIGIFMLIMFMALPVRAFAFWVLQELHLLTVVLSLVVFLLFDKYLKAKKGKIKYAYLISGFTTLTLTLVNGNISFIICAAPLIFISLYFIYSAYREKIGFNKTEKGLKTKPDFSGYIIVLFTVIASVVLKELILFEINKNGFKLSPFGLPVSFVRLRDFQKNIYFFAGGVLKLFNINVFGKYFFSVQALINICKLTGFFVFLSGIIYIFKKIKIFNGETGIYFLDFLLLTGLAVMSAAFLLSDIPISKSSARYLIPVVIYGFLISFRNVPRFEVVYKNYEKLWFKLIASFIVLVYAGSFIIASGSVIPSSPFRPLSDFLIKHNLRYGFAPYMDAGIITLISKNKVKVRQVRYPMYPGRIIPYEWVSNINWYRKKGFFVIYTKYFIYGGVDKQSIIHSFGKPSKIYVEDFQGTIGRAHGRPDGKYTMPPYVIMVYNQGIKAK